MPSSATTRCRICVRNSCNSSRDVMSRRIVSVLAQSSSDHNRNSGIPSDVMEMAAPHWQVETAAAPSGRNGRKMSASKSFETGVPSGVVFK